MIDVALNPAEAKRERELTNSVGKNDQPVGRQGFKNKFGTNVPQNRVSKEPSMSVFWRMTDTRVDQNK